MITAYGALAYEKSSLEIDYNYKNYDNQTEKISLKMDGSNDFKATLGLRYSILVLDFFADYSIANTSTINFGLGASF